MKDNRTGKLLRLLEPRSLRYQLLSRTLLLLAALLLLIGILQYFLMKDFLYQNKAETLTAQIMAMPIDWFRPEGEIGRAPDSRLEPDTAGNAASMDGWNERGHRQSPVFYQPGLSLAFVDKDGTVTDLSKESDSSLPALTATQVAEIEDSLQMRGQIEYTLVNDSAGDEQLVVYRLAGPPNRSEGLIQASTDTASLKQLLMTQLAIFAGLAVIALAAGLALYLPLLRRTLKPLSRIVLAARQIDAGNLTGRLPVSQGQEEIDRLSDALGGMLERLNRSFEAERRTTAKMRRFITDASHELRTPLTSIHGFLEVLLRGAASNPEQLHRALSSMHLESKRINKLVEDLLAVAKLDQEPRLQLSPARLDLVIAEMEPQLQLLAGSRKLELSLAPDIQGSFHADQLKQVVLNLVLNAVQHTDAGTGLIRLTLQAKGNLAELTVADNGSGIPEEHLPHIFERFYRSETSRTRKTGGAGLGLSITKSIVEAHRGTITAESKPGEGTLFRVRLPLNA
ncbi:HAMP domain-containing histidine kinase [Paenibacillus sp. N4]|uniref:sensor histidine kinase n=1 Tax=Paenibacillus vietnamensis TaxID=2590547 RepID=UPI001CD16103|nr:HAMP domain-containing sensor histidine kinase [Paenibacillus vietnamensis]MCA0755154.1 HAMP domain-containing histidine kinase [Paenibacillus vietnamensis]